MELDQLDGASDFSRKTRFKNKFKNSFTNPYNILVFFSIILLSYLILVPLLEMIISSLTLAKVDAKLMGGRVGQFTTYYWQKIIHSQISKNVFFKPLAHSMVISIFTSGIGVLLGAVLAWLMVRSDLPHKKFFAPTLIIPYMLPSWALALSYNTIFRNAKIGGNPGFLSFLGMNIPDWLSYGPFPIIVVLTTHYYAYSYLLVSSALRSINSEVEEMGEIVGASKRQILTKITFPLVLPAILSAVILTFSKAIGTYAVPSMLGLKVNYYTISTMIHSTVNSSQANLGLTISLVLISISALVIFINQLLIGKRKSYVTQSGKGTRSNTMSLGKAKIPILILMYIFVIFLVFIPFILMFYQTLMMKSGDYSFSNLTLHYWIGHGTPEIYEGLDGVLLDSRFFSFLWNTIKLVFMTSIIASLIGLLVGYVCARGRKLRSGRFVEQLSFIPYLIPSIAFGAMFLSMFSTPTTIDIFNYQITLIPGMYGSFALLVLVSVVKHLPFASRAGTSSMLQIGAELEEAGQIAGVSFVKRFRKIIIPLAKHGLMSGFMLIFISIMKELDLIILLMSPTQGTLSYLAYWYSIEGWTQPSNAIALIMFLLIFITNWASSKYFDADITGGLGG